MIPVVAPPLEQPPARATWLWPHQETNDDAPPTQLPSVLIGLSAAAVLVAAMIRRRLNVLRGDGRGVNPR
jgi:hypothetical protein